MEQQKKELMMAVGSRIKYFRQMKALSQEDTALSANLNTAYFGQVERGLKCPTIDTLYRISNALEVPLPELLKTDYPKALPENQVQRLIFLLAKIPEDKKEHFFKLVEDVAELF